LLSPALENYDVLSRVGAACVDSENLAHTLFYVHRCEILAVEKKKEIKHHRKRGGTFTPEFFEPLVAPKRWKSTTRLSPFSTRPVMSSWLRPIAAERDPRELGRRDGIGS